MIDQVRQRARHLGHQLAGRRLAVVETLVLDPSRRLVLVSCDGREQLLLLGEGRVIASPAEIG